VLRRRQGFIPVAERPIQPGKRRAAASLPITESELHVIAAAASIGLVTWPIHGTSRPAATGIASAVVEERQKQILPHGSHRRRGEIEGPRQRGQAAGEERDVGRFEGDIGGRAHRDADIRRREPRHVVDAIADEHEPLPPRLAAAGGGSAGPASRTRPCRPVRGCHEVRRSPRPLPAQAAAAGASPRAAPWRASSGMSSAITAAASGQGGSATVTSPASRPSMPMATVVPWPPWPSSAAVGDGVTPSDSTNAGVPMTTRRPGPRCRRCPAHAGPHVGGLHERHAGLVGRQHECAGPRDARSLLRGSPQGAEDRSPGLGGKRRRVVGDVSRRGLAARVWRRPRWPRSVADRA